MLQNLRSHLLPAGRNASDCPATLVQRQASWFSRKNIGKRSPFCRTLIAADPNNPALHFAMGYVHQQQDDWDDASDSYDTARSLMPGLSDIHSRLAYLFYRSDEAGSAIAEARTALSIDPRNAEAYRFLGLGLYANGQYKAAVHAFRESLASPAQQRRRLLRPGNYSPRPGRCGWRRGRLP